MIGWLLRGLLCEEAGEGGEGGGGAGGDEQQLDAKALAAEVARLKAENEEKESAVRYWHEQAKSGVKQSEPAKKEEPEPESEDLIEVLSKNGAKGLAQVLKKHGFVSREEVEAAVNSKANQIATENELAKQYPELVDNKSDFFKSTAGHYKELVESGVPQTVAMKIAAERAELDGLKSGKRLSQADRDERAARAKAAGGDKGARNRQDDDDDDGDGELDDFALRMCEAMEIEPEAYKKRAKSGVQVRGIPEKGKRK